MSDAFETRLREAFSPVEPPPHLEDRLESTLTSLIDQAADELESWELRTMRDPRNWIRPAAAVVIGGGAATGLVLLRAKQQRGKRAAAARNPIDLAGRTIRDVADEAKRVFDR